MDRNRPPEGQSVTPATDVTLARNWAAILEEREARRGGVSRTDARKVVARKAGVTPGKLYSLARNRLKEVSNATLRGIGGALVRDLQNELARVEHDLAIHTQIGVGIDNGETLSLLASREKIRAALGLSAPDQGGAS